MSVPVVGGARQDGRVDDEDLHRPYVDAVARALKSAGLPVGDWWAQPGDVRSGGFGVAESALVGTPLAGGSLWLGWSEESGWYLTASAADVRGMDVGWSGLAVVCEPGDVVAWVRGVLDGTRALELRRPQLREADQDDGFTDALARWAAGVADGRERE